MATLDNGTPSKSDVSISEGTMSGREVFAGNSGDRLLGALACSLGDPEGWLMGPSNSALGTSEQTRVAGCGTGEVLSGISSDREPVDPMCPAGGERGPVEPDNSGGEVRP